MEKVNSEVEYYKAISEVYLLELQNHIEPSEKILIAMGVIVQMNSDLVSYLLKNKSTEKSKAQSKRLEVLMEVMNYFSVIADRNLQMKGVVKRFFAEHKKLEDVIVEKDRQIEILNKMLQDEPD